MQSSSSDERRRQARVKCVWAVCGFSVGVSGRASGGESLFAHAGVALAPWGSGAVGAAGHQNSVPS